MTERRQESVEALRISLHGQTIGVLAHFSGGKNILTFDPGYVRMAPREGPLATLTQLRVKGLLDKPIIRSHRLDPLLSNLLPEGALRTWMATTLKVDSENEFPLIAWTGENLPGAFIASAIPPGEIPDWSLSPRDQVEPVRMPVNVTANKFSLAGVQMKFSSIRVDGRYNLDQQEGEEHWIIKTPSTVHRGVPQNEYSAMRLAEAIGVHIPDIQIVAVSDLENLPDIPLPNEDQAYAIRRFDRELGKRVHAEDFAQIFGLYAHDKYGRANYEMIGKAIYQYGSEGLDDLQQMSRRLLANFLLANGDAHIKNWSMYYPDTRSPRLSPAYDILSTLPYVENERAVALNMAAQKDWYKFDKDTFRRWSEKIGVAWPAIRVHIDDALERARDVWPAMLSDLPMLPEHHAVLRQHWQNVHTDFRVL